MSLREMDRLRVLNGVREIRTRTRLLVNHYFGEDTPAGYGPSDRDDRGSQAELGARTSSQRCRWMRGGGTRPPRPGYLRREPVSSAPPAPSHRATFNRPTEHPPGLDLHGATPASCFACSPSPPRLTAGPHHHGLFSSLHGQTPHSALSPPSRGPPNRRSLAEAWVRRTPESRAWAGEPGHGPGHGLRALRSGRARARAWPPWSRS